MNQEIYTKVYKAYGRYYEPLTGVPAEKITHDVLSFDKPTEQLAILERYAGSLHGKKLLEMGSGFGIFVTVARTRGIDAYGVEPDGEGFGDSFVLSQQILKLNGIDPSYIKNGFGEKLPYPDAVFDVVYSTNVLEHVTDPQAFISEAIRVCRPGGTIQIVVPNYGSFYDGHYGCFYLPYQPQWLWKLFIKYIHKKDTAYVDTLRTEINYWSTSRILRPFIKNKTVSVITFGEEVFAERMKKINFSTWAGLEKVKKWLTLIHKLKLVYLATWFLCVTKAYSPLIITLKKEK